ncbi:hypothetical protein AAFF_G00352310 [Aldrovandia affinis]|uniref:Uncharacterized protein n=1 Tax=Aldrovandia affinis TaxID=143900 RepID=A0AAD7SIW6_9TELE|nr:hypothetical protein AAFF_G00352310 [Aldrovandia affinis]
MAWQRTWEVIERTQDSREMRSDARLVWPIFVSVSKCLCEPCVPPQGESCVWNRWPRRAGRLKESPESDRRMPSVSLSLPTALAGQARTWVCLSCMFWVSYPLLPSTLAPVGGLGGRRGRP